MAKLNKIMHNLTNTLSLIHQIISVYDIDDRIKLFTWSRCEQLLNEINSTVKNIAECVSHRMCLPKICNGKFLPLTGGTETLMELYELLSGVPDLNMNVAIVLSTNVTEFQVSADELLCEWISKLNNTPHSIKDHAVDTANTSINEKLRIKELEISLAECETQAFIANYQRNSLIAYLNNISEIVSDLDGSHPCIGSFSSGFDGEELIDLSTASKKSDSACHKIDYLISPLSLPLNNNNSSELAGYVTTLVKDGMALAEDKAKITNELADLRAELSKERERREAAEESCRASIHELTRHLGTMELTIMDYENKLSQLRKGH